MNELWGFLKQGGPLMVPILVFSVVALAVFLDQPAAAWGHDGTMRHSARLPPVRARQCCVPVVSQVPCAIRHRAAAMRLHRAIRGAGHRGGHHRPARNTMRRQVFCPGAPERAGEQISERH